MREDKLYIVLFSILLFAELLYLACTKPLGILFWLDSNETSMHAVLTWTRALKITVEIIEYQFLFSEKW
jgi:hypothetical protein